MFFFFKQKTAYEIYQCDWSSDVCSSDLDKFGERWGLKGRVRWLFIALFCEGLALMRRRRSGRKEAQLTDGPAKLCQALGIDGDWDGYDICRPEARLFVARGVDVPAQSVTKGPRVGLNSVAEPWKSIAWGFRLAPETVKRWREEDTCHMLRESGH